MATKKKRPKTQKVSQYSRKAGKANKVGAHKRSKPAKKKKR
jgi:hypothetical protein